MALSGFGSSATVKLVADTFGFNRDLAGAQSQFNRTTRSMEQDVGRLGRGAIAGTGLFHGLGRSIAFASGSFLGGYGLLRVTETAIGNAEQLGIQLDKTRRIFGDSAREVTAWSRTTARAFGIAQSDALSSADKFAQLFHAMGLTGNQTVTMSRNLTELSAKLALLAHTDPAEAQNALAQALAGRARALRSYGIVIDSTTVKAEAMRLGLIKSAVSSQAVADAETRLAIETAKAAEAHKKYGDNTTQAASADLAVQKAHEALAKATAGVSGQMSSAAKATATYSLIQQQSTAAAKVWRDSQGSLAVQEQKLRAELKNTETEIGIALLPTITKLTRGMADWLGKSQNQKRVTDDLKTALGALKDIIQTIGAVIRRVDGVTGSFKHTMELLLGLAVASKIGGWVGAFTRLGGGMSGASGKTTALIGNLRTLLGFAGAVVTITVVEKLVKTLVDAHPLRHVGSETIYTAAGPVEVAIAPGTHPGPMVTMDGVTYYRGADGNYYRTRGEAAAASVKGRAHTTGIFGAVGSAVTGATGGLGGTAAGGIQGSLVATGKTALGVPYHYGGAPSLSKPTDCSGLMVAVFARNGITLPRTSQEQYAAAPIKNRRPLLAGDLVFSEGIHPGHVGLYIGGGDVLEDPHTGDHVKIIPLASFGWNGLSARWWGGKARVGGGAAAQTPTGATTGATDLHVGTAAHKPARPRAVTDPVPASLEQRLSVARDAGNLKQEDTLLTEIIGIYDRLIAKAKTARRKKELLAQEQKYLSARRSVEGQLAQGFTTDITKQVSALSKIIAALEKGPFTAVDITDAAGNVIGKQFGEITSVRFDPKTKTWITVKVRPTLDGAKKELNYILKTVLPGLDKRIRSLSNTINKYARHPKRNAALIADARKRRAALIAERKEIVQMASDLAEWIAEMEQAIATPPNQEAGGGGGGGGGGEVPTSITALPAGLTYATAAAEFAGDTAGELSLLGQQAAILESRLATTGDPGQRQELFTAIEGIRQQEASVATSVPLDIQLGFAQARVSGDQTKTRALTQQLLEIVNARLSESQSIEESIALMNEKADLQSQLNQLQQQENRQAFAYLAAQRQLVRQYGSNILTNALAGATINLNSYYGSGPDDPHLYSQAVLFELLAGAG